MVLRNHVVLTLAAQAAGDILLGDDAATALHLNSEEQANMREKKQQM